MIPNDEPVAFFITWTVYGTWLQGDVRGWRKYGSGHQNPQPLLAQWRRERLIHPVVLLGRNHRAKIANEITEHSRRREWKLWAVNPRTNHVHVVVSSVNATGAKIRDQLKANCTRGLRELDAQFVGRPVWSRGGDWHCVNSEEDLDVVVKYVNDAQDWGGESVG